MIVYFDTSALVEQERAAARFQADWSTFHRVRLDGRLLPDVRRILERHALKGADAVHLASACLVLRGCTTSGLACSFACDDRALSAAANVEGLTLSW